MSWAACTSQQLIILTNFTSTDCRHIIVYDCTLSFPASLRHSQGALLTVLLSGDTEVAQYNRMESVWCYANHLTSLAKADRRFCFV